MTSTPRIRAAKREMIAARAEMLAARKRNAVPMPRWTPAHTMGTMIAGACILVAWIEGLPV